MSSGLAANNPTIVSAFHQTLLHQGLIVLLVFALAAIGRSIWRSFQWRSGSQPVALRSPALAGAEPAGRRLLRISFGIIWIFDGILQAQAAMPLGLIPQAVAPTANASPVWVRHVVDAGSTIWTYHPVAAAASAVWIQLGIGVWLLVAPRGIWSRLGGLGSVAWGLVVWVFGEAFGGIFAAGLSWLTGAPGAVLFYCAAGVLLAVPERLWESPALGRVVLRVLGLFFLGMALLQAWPGRGSWQGHTTGALPGMVQQMEQTPQPHWLASWLAAFESFVAAHGWGVNLFVVIVLTVVGACFLTSRPRLAGIGAGLAAVLCLADWVLVQDLGFFGGVGTDPNSMVPMALLCVAGWLAVSRLPGTDCPKVTRIASPSAPSWRQRVLTASPTYVSRVALTVGAAGIVLVGALPMAAATADPHASAILTQAIDGSPEVVQKPAPAFRLLDQSGRPVSMADLRGKAVALVFLDDVCTSVCPIIAQELRGADGLLGSHARQVELVAVNANPLFTAPDYLAAFDRQEGMNKVPNWLFLTGSPSQLRRMWRSYGITVTYLPAGAMVGHSLYAYVIDPDGQLRYLLNTDPGPGTDATQSSFTTTLSDTLKTVLRRS